MIRLGLLLFVSVASFSIAENRGVSHLGLCHAKYDCAGMVRSFDRVPVIRTGWLDNTFNPKGCTCLPHLQNSKKPVEVRVHIVNGAGLRNRRLERHEIHAGLTIGSLEKYILRAKSTFLDRFRKRLSVVKMQLRKIKNLKQCFVSPVLESDLGDRARKKLLRITAKEIPECRAVDNPLKKTCLKGFVCEKHGEFSPLKGPYIADLDGLDFYSIDANQWAEKHKNAVMTLAWTLCNNLIDSTFSFSPPTKRSLACFPWETIDLNNFLTNRR